MPPISSRSRFRPIIRVFVSSTFSDLVAERNALQDRVWPELERHCLARGFQFQAIDLRWGVPTEAGLDHRTMRICLEELRRSQEVSPQPNFLILLGDRYGWQPLPEEISTAEFDALKEAAAGNEADARILEDWYRLDENAVPAVHLLRSRRDSPDGRDYTKDAGGRDTPAWVDVQNVLWKLINRVFSPTRLAERFAEWPPKAGFVPPIVRFQGSATEQEIWHGAFSVADAAQHVVAFSREIANLEVVAGRPKLNDLVNLDQSRAIDQNLLDANDALKRRLRDLLGKNYLESPEPAVLRAVADEGGEPQFEISTDHLDSLCAHVRDRLLCIVQRQIDDYHRVPETAEGSPVPGEVLLDLKREREEHERFAAERAPEGVFVGREAEQAKILAYLTGAADRPFILHGVSGSGKSALMASAARKASKESNALVVQRFLGISKHSSDLRSLLVDLCQTLREQFPLTEELPTDIRLLEKEFYEQLKHATAERPIDVFLDALDQLDAAENSHSLWWIRSTPLPAHARLVLSCLSDLDDKIAGHPWTVLKQRGFLTEANSVAIEHLHPNEARLLWNRWLDQADRRLKADQQAAVDARILPDEATVCRQPLYLKILFEEARSWRSYDPRPQIGRTVPDLLDTLFARLTAPAGHGPLVEPALGYLVCARYGLTETEILEILFSDPDYRHALIASSHHALPPRSHRIPIAIWSRLRHDLSSYLSERGAPGGTVLHFYHRQVASYAGSRFLDQVPASRSLRHRRSADFFWNRPVDLRKVTELPWHLVQLRAWSDLTECLGDIAFFSPLWHRDRDEALAYWTRIQATIGLSPVETYRDRWESSLEKGQDVLAVAQLLFITGHMQDAGGIIEAVLQLCRDDDQRARMFAMALEGHASHLALQGDRAAARAAYERCAQIYRKTNDPGRLAIALSGLATTLADQYGDQEGALEIWREQEEVFRRLGDWRSLQACVGNQATVYLTRHDDRKAVALEYKAATICEDHGLHSELQHHRLHLAILHNRRGEWQRALEILGSAEQECRALRYQGILGGCLAQQASILAQHGRLGKALAKYEEAESCFSETDAIPALVQSLVEHGFACFQRRSRQRGLEKVRRAWRLIEEHRLADFGTLREKCLIAQASLERLPATWGPVRVSAAVIFVAAVLSWCCGVPLAWKAIRVWSMPSVEGRIVSSRVEGDVASNRHNVDVEIHLDYEYEVGGTRYKKHANFPAVLVRDEQRGVYKKLDLLAEGQPVGVYYDADAPDRGGILGDFLTPEEHSALVVGQLLWKCAEWLFVLALVLQGYETFRQIEARIQYR